MKQNEPVLEFVFNELTENYSKYFEVKTKPTFSLLEHQSKRLSEILKYQLRVNGSGKKNIYIKIQKNPDHERTRIEEFCQSEYDTLKKLHNAFEEYPNFGVTKPICCFRQHLVTITEEAKGENLFNILKSNGNVFTAKEGFEQLKRYCYSCGEWLQTFQNITDTHKTLKLREVGLIERITEDFKRWNLLSIQPKSQSRILNYLEEKIEEFGSEEILIAGQHGDFIPFNVIARPEQTIVLDFPYYRDGPVYDDLARFYAVLITMPKNILYRYRDMEILTEAFLEGYKREKTGFSSEIFKLFLIKNMVNWLSWEKSLITNGLVNKLVAKRVISYYVQWFKINSSEVLAK